MNDPIAVARWQGTIEEKLDTISKQISEIKTDKEATHAVIYLRLDKVERAINDDRLESAQRWSKLAGMAIGLAIGSGLAGGAGGAIVSILFK